MNNFKVHYPALRYDELFDRKFNLLISFIGISKFLRISIKKFVTQSIFTHVF